MTLFIIITAIVLYASWANAFDEKLLNRPATPLGASLRASCDLHSWSYNHAGRLQCTVCNLCPAATAVMRDEEVDYER